MKSQINRLRFAYEENANPYGHSVKCEFEIDPDPSLDKICELCKRFALLMGYSESAVERVFGEDSN